MTRWFTLIAIALLTTACSPIPVPSPLSGSSPTPLVTVSPIPLSLTPGPSTPETPTPLLPNTPTPTPLPTRTNYTLLAALNYETKSLAVVETIHYRNTTSENMTEILLVVEANWIPGIFQLNSLAWENGQPIEGWTLNDNLLRAPLPDPLSPDAWLTLSVDYGINLPAQAGVLGFDFRQVNLGNWYPFIPPYEPGVGWLAYQRGWVGESFSLDLADFIVELTLSKAAPTTVVAASAPAKQEGAAYRFYLPNARSFALSISHEYQVFRKMVGDVEILSYAYPETLAAGEQALNATADALALYSDLFGPYPHPSMTVVQVNFPDGLEFDGLYFLSEQYYWGYVPTVTGDITVQNYLTIIAVHETAHQWWYGLLGNNQAIEPWLDETFAVYSELIYYEHYHPELVEWWWALRVDFYEPRDCCINNTIYHYGDARAYINAVYLRGAYFMQELRELMGDEALFAALKTYTEQNREGFVTAQDFWAIIEEYTTEDLTPLRLRYFSGG